MQRKGPPAIGFLKGLQYVGHQIEFQIVFHKPGIAIDIHLPGIFGRFHQHGQRATLTARHLAARFQIRHKGHSRQALFNRRQQAHRNLVIQDGRADILHRLCWQHR